MRVACCWLWYSIGILLFDWHIYHFCHRPFVTTVLKPTQTETKPRVEALQSKPVKAPNKPTACAPSKTTTATSRRDCTNKPVQKGKCLEGLSSVQTPTCVWVCVQMCGCVCVCFWNHQDVCSEPPGCVFGPPRCIICGGLRQCFNSWPGDYLELLRRVFGTTRVSV